MFNTRGFNKEGLHQNGTYFDQEWFNKFWFNQDRIHQNWTRYNKHGFDADWVHKNWTLFDENGFNKKAVYIITWTRFNHEWFDRDWLDLTGFNRRWYNKFGYDRDWFNAEWFDISGYDRNGFNKYWKSINWTQYNNVWFNQFWFSRLGFNAEWFDMSGYNHKWFNKAWYDRKWYNLNGFNERGYDKAWFNNEWLTSTWSDYNHEWFDKYWFNKFWFDKEWKYKNWTKFNDRWFDKYWFDEYGYDKDGYTHSGYSKNWTHKNWTKFNDKWFNVSGFDKDGFDQFGFNKIWYNKDGYGKWGYDKSWFNRAWFNAQGQNRDDLLFKIHSPVFQTFLNKQKWEEADKYLEDIKINPYDDRWADLRKVALEWYLSKYKNIYWDWSKVSEEQRKFLVDLSSQILLQARAWSGKTTTLIYKTHFLLNELQYKKNEIIFLAFNKSAVNDVNEKFAQNWIDRFQNAMTFHSLAGRIGSNEDYVAEDKDFQMNRLVGEVIRKVLEDETMRDLLYEVFRKESEEGDISPEYDEFISAKWSTSSEYYELVRDNRTYQTLDGKIVKSKAEKWLADFFFEHDIRYSYERTVQYEKKKENIRGYSPDFCLDGFKVKKWFENKIQNWKVWIEFWWIDENDSKKQVNPDWDTTWEQYHDEMNWKRWFWTERSEDTLIEFSISDVSYKQENAREWFEERIQSTLESNGIICSKLPYEVLIKKVIELFKTKIEEMVEQFINRSKQRKFSPKDIEDQISSLDLSPNSRVWMFYIFSNHCYDIYTDILRNIWKKDYNDILIEATKKVHQEKWNIDIKISKKYNIRANLLELRYIMIDEYQDFSQLYFDLVNAMQKYNKNLKIVCVGDDWQLINSFAWSQRCFYDEYWRDEYFPWGKKLSLVKTWRCPQEIVSLSNSLMRWLWDGTKCGKWNHGNISWKYIWDVFIQFKKEFTEEYERDGIYYIDESWKKDLFRDKKNEERARYLKYCCDIIFKSKKENKKCTFLIMSRMNSIPFQKEQLIEAYFQRLKQEYPSFDWESENVNQKRKEIEESIIMQTVHKSKGAEADVCILLQVWELKRKSKAKFPFLHPDYPFWILFWDTPKSIFEEERRLYYVALTRTKKDLYFISETEITNSKWADDFLISTFNKWVSSISK